MSSRITNYQTPPPIRSSLVKSPTDAIPPIDELEALQSELKLLRQRTVERGRKAEQDIILLQESFKRIKEKEKGKGKAVEKFKKERGRAYICLAISLPNGSNHLVLFYCYMYNVRAAQTLRSLMAKTRGCLCNRRVCSNLVYHLWPPAPVILGCHHLRLTHGSCKQATLIAFPCIIS